MQSFDRGENTNLKFRFVVTIELCKKSIRFVLNYWKRIDMVIVRFFFEFSKE